ncbi:MAG: hypothetical protein BalsKO_16540 [Balneolaceae bacterium]
MLNSICKILVILLFLSIFSLASKAQTRVETPAFTFMTIRPDAQTTMNSGTLTGIPSTVPTAFFYNPAQLGNFGNTNSFSFQFFPGGNTWFNNVSIHSNSFVAGAKLEGLPLSIGIGYMNFGVDYGRQDVRTVEDPTGENGETFSARDYSNMLGIGVQLHSPINISMGYSVKKIVSRIYSQKFSGNAFDLGILASYNLKMEQIKAGLSLGYSIRNEGKRIDGLSLGETFIDINEEDIPATIVNQKYSLPRNHILGYGLTLGFEEIFLNQQRTIFNFSWSAQTEESRYKYSDSDFLLTNANIPSLFDNMIIGKSGDDIINSHALSLDILESITVSWGEYYGDGFDNRVKNFGFTLFANPLLSFFFDGNENSFSKFFFSHLDFSYSLSTYSAPGNPVLDNTYISGFTISVNGL